MTTGLKAVVTVVEDGDHEPRFERVPIKRYRSFNYFDR